MDLADHIRACEREQLVVALQLTWVIREMCPTEIVFDEPESLDHRTHGAVKDEDALTQDVCELGKALGARWTAGHGGLLLRLNTKRKSLSSAYLHVQMFY